MLAVANVGLLGGARDAPMHPLRMMRVIDAGRLRVTSAFFVIGTPDEAAP